MIIILTGTTAVGKSTTAWSIVSQLPEITFIECDTFGYRKPFDWGKKSDLIDMYEQLIMNMKFRQERGTKNFVTVITAGMALYFPEMKPLLEKISEKIYPFRLNCNDKEIERRIKHRGRVEMQQKLEFDLYSQVNKMLDETYPDEKIFKRIETIHGEVMPSAKKIIEISTSQHESF